MNFIVNNTIWAYGAPDPKEILGKYFHSKFTLVKGENGQSDYFELKDISADELASLVMDESFDIKIQPMMKDVKRISFDGPNRGFRQR